LGGGKASSGISIGHVSWLTFWWVVESGGCLAGNLFKTAGETQNFLGRHWNFLGVNRFAPSALTVASTGGPIWRLGHVFPGGHLQPLPLFNLACGQGKRDFPGFRGWCPYISIGTGGRVQSVWRLPISVPESPGGPGGFFSNRPPVRPGPPNGLLRGGPFLSPNKVCRLVTALFFVAEGPS